MFFTRAPRLTRPRLIILAGVLAVAGLLLASIQADSAHAATTRTADATAQSGASGPKPAIVLVHGAWADSGSWNAVTRILQADGYTVYAPPNPLRGLATDSATLSDFLKTLSGPVILVGHSYGGAVITNAATGEPQVKALVYVDAFAPPQGQTLAHAVAFLRS
jgi:pimeloyl-ACP methyl ester carboxylesterase